jgi:hypothetical protein
VSQYKSPVPDNQTPEVTPVEAIPPQPVAAPGSQDLSTQIEALRAKNAELIGERRKDKEARDTLQNQLDQLAQAQQEAKTQKPRNWPKPANTEPSGKKPNKQSPTSSNKSPNVMPPSKKFAPASPKNKSAPPPSPNLPKPVQLPPISCIV